MLIVEKVSNKVRNIIPSIIAISENLSPRIKFCEDIVRPDKIVINNHYWQQVINKDIYLYSAYYDNRYNLKGVSYDFVRVLAIVRNDLFSQKLYCYLWCNYTKSPLVVSVVSIELWVDLWPKDLSLMLYKSYLFSCAVPKKYRHRVTAVSISGHECIKPFNYIKIGQNNSTHNDRKDFAVCVKGMDFREDISIRLVEWIELQLLLGVDLISFYIYYINNSTEKVLNYYKKLGKIETKFVSLPGDQPNEPRIRSQYLADNVWQKRRLELIPYNDCLYNHLNSHKFIVLLDLDEAIVPRLHTNWHQMIDYITNLEPNALRQYSSLSAQNTYYFASVPKPKPKGIANGLVMLRHIYRSSNFSRPGFAVKSFITTDKSLAVFNHYSLFPLFPNMSRYSMISKSLAQLNHYRHDCPNTMFVECQQNFMKFFTKDTLIWKYKNQLIKRILNVSMILGFNDIINN